MLNRQHLCRHPYGWHDAERTTVKKLQQIIPENQKKYQNLHEHVRHHTKNLPIEKCYRQVWGYLLNIPMTKELGLKKSCKSRHSCFSPYLLNIPKDLKNQKQPFPPFLHL